MSVDIEYVALKGDGTLWNFKNLNVKFQVFLTTFLKSVGFHQNSLLMTRLQLIKNWVTFCVIIAHSSNRQVWDSLSREYFAYYHVICHFVYSTLWLLFRSESKQRDDDVNDGRNIYFYCILKKKIMFKLWQRSSA